MRTQKKLVAAIISAMMITISSGCRPPDTCTPIPNGKEWGWTFSAPIQDTVVGAFVLPLDSMLVNIQIRVGDLTFDSNSNVSSSYADFIEKELLVRGLYDPLNQSIHFYQVDDLAVPFGSNVALDVIFAEWPPPPGTVITGAGITEDDLLNGATKEFCVIEDTLGVELFDDNFESGDTSAWSIASVFHNGLTSVFKVPNLTKRSPERAKLDRLRKRGSMPGLKKGAARQWAG